MMRTSVAEARRVLRDVLIDRIVFRPVPRPPELPPVQGPRGRAKLVYEVVGVTKWQPAPASLQSCV